MLCRLSSILSPLLLVMFCALSSGQVSTTGSIEVQDYYTSGTFTQTTAEAGSVHRKIYHNPSASALRVVFGAYTLGPNDWIEVYAPGTGERHKLTPAELTKWQGTSAFFNGNTLWIDLILAPGSSGSFDIISYFVGLGGIPSGATHVGYQTICGSDDRVSSNDNRVARFVANGSVVGGGCTLFLASPDGCAISAGHCFAVGTLLLAEFNCPPSLPNGDLQHPPISDQFPIDVGSITYSNIGPGDDWGICKLLPNNLGQTAVSLYGFFNVIPSIPNINDILRITGFGVDDNVDNQTNQTHAGALVGVLGTSLQYNIDTNGGNSGAPVIDETSGNVVGIHTNGGCTTSGTGSNSGTSTSLVGFQTALTTLCNQFVQAPAAGFTQSATTIAVGQAITFTDISSGQPSSWDWDFDGDNITDATTAIASFSYATPGTYDVKLTVSNPLGTDSVTMTALVNVINIVPASLPYSEDFTQGLPTSAEWLFASVGATGRISASNFGSDAPISGSPSLAMDSSVNQTFATNSSSLFLDLTVPETATITYWFKDVNDEPHPEDGLFLSDGTTEILLQDHGNLTNLVWTEITIDIGAAASAAGMPLTNNMQLIFRQRDNYAINGDGHLIDDISVVAAPFPDTGQRNQASSALTSPGMVDKDGLIPSADQNGPFFISLPTQGFFRLDVQGPANGAMTVFYGQLNRGNAFFPGNGQLDLGLLGINNFSDIGILIDGITSNDFYGFLSASGTQFFSAFLPPIFQSGDVIAFQALTSPNFQLTAAIELSIQ